MDYKKLSMIVDNTQSSVDFAEVCAKLADKWDEQLPSKYGIDFIEVFSHGDEFYFTPKCDPTHDLSYLCFSVDDSGNLQLIKLGRTNQLTKELAEFLEVSEKEIRKQQKKWDSAIQEIVADIKEEFKKETK